MVYWDENLRDPLEKRAEKKRAETRPRSVSTVLQTGVKLRAVWRNSPVLLSLVVLLTLKPAEATPPLILEERLSQPALPALKPAAPVHEDEPPAIDPPRPEPDPSGSLPDNSLPDSEASPEPASPRLIAAESLPPASNLMPAASPAPATTLQAHNEASPEPASPRLIAAKSLPPASNRAADLISPLSPSTTLASATPPAPTLKAETDSASPASSAPLPPRLGVGYNGATHEGNAAFGRLEGFIPLRQNPGGDLTFLEGRVLLDNDANLGSNAILGHRAYNAKDNRIYGGYISYDTRNTEHRFFQQIGLGFESLGDVWDLRTNFYLPIGDVSQQADVDIFDTGLLVTDTRFSGNNLLFDTFRQRSERRLREAAVFSFEIEGGGRIAKLGKRGDLRLYGGPYYYSPPGGRDVVGWRTRLVARPNNHLTLSLGAQTDALFGTNLLFQIGASFPSGRPKGKLDRESSVLARLGNFVERNNSITIDQQESRSFFQEEFSVVARNPATGEPWFFNHVTLGRSGGNGTFENPFGTVQDGLNTTRSDGNDIVYVAQGNNPGIPAFTIPDRVQVLSRGPVQTIPVQTTLQSQREPFVSTTIASPVQLPFSASGNFPLVTNTVTMGSDTVLSGFTVTVDGGPALGGRNLTNATVRDNFLTSRNSTTDGITLENISGSFDLSNSSITISNPANSGISASGISGTANLAATTGSTVTNSSGAQAGILLQNSTGTINFSGLNVTSTGTPALRASSIGNTNFNTGQLASTNSTTNGITLDSIDGTFALSNTTVTASNATDSGIEVTNSSGTVNLRANAGSRISGAGGSGIEILNGTGATAVSGFEIEQANTSGILAQNSRNLTLENNRISTTGDDAAGIRLSNPGGTVTIANNQIATLGNTTNTAFNNANFVVDGAHGIEIDLSNASLEGATISGNRITTQGTWAVGILTSARDGGTLAAATISGNTVSTAGNNARGIYFRARSISRSATLTSAILSGNTISTMGDIAHGIYSSARSIGGSASIASLTISGNTISTMGDNARGIYSMARGDGGSASIASLTISGNTISTSGASAHGISSFARSTSGSASIASATTSGNTISTAGNFARGIFARALSFGGSATFTSATITSNTISTAGNFARGIVSFARSDGGSATLAAATITGNTVSTGGSNAYGIYAYSRKNGGGNSASLCTTLVGNTATTQQANADAFRFNRIVIGPGTATFQIVDTAGTFPTTQANNTASVPGGGMPFNFIGGPVNVASCP